MRKKKYGRKRIRHTQALLHRILVDGHTLSQEKRNFRGLKMVSIAARFAQALRAYVSAPAPRPPRGPYTLIVDGVYFKFKRKEWVLYLMALKPVHSHQMCYLDPALIQGRERLEEWYTVIDTIPQGIKTQITAPVSDGLRGFQQLAASNGCAVRILLANEPVERRGHARLALRRHINNSACPSYVRKHVLEFSEREQDFRSYLTHPHLHLPTTTSAMESTGRLVRKATRTARTPESLRSRAVAFLRLKRSVVCNGFDVQH